MATTTSEMTIYIATTGDDEHGDGSAGNPYATWDKALSLVPLYLEHRVRIKAKAGTYTSFPEHLSYHAGRHGMLSLEGMDPPTTVAGPFTITTATQVGHADGAGWDLEVAGAGWTPDQWYGKFVRMTSGLQDGRVHSLMFNSADTVSLSAPCYNAIVNGDTFIVIDPSTVIESELAPVFSFRGDGMPGRYYSQFVLANLEFVTDMTYVLGDSHYYPYSFNESCAAIFGLVRFVGLDPSITIWEQSAGLINLQGIEYQLPLVPLLEDDTLIMDYPHTQVGAVQITAGPTPPIAAACWIQMDGANSVERGTQISHCVCRNGVYVDSIKSEFFFSGLGFVDVDHRSTCNFFNSRFIGAGLAKYAARSDDGSFIDVVHCWFDSCTTDAISVSDCSHLTIVDTGGTLADIVGYGVRVGRISRMLVEGIVDLEGSSGLIRFSQSSTTVAYPVAPNVETDGMGSFVVA